jgi:CTP synthase (UTP-ammonia lyase)
VEQRGETGRPAGEQPQPTGRPPGSQWVAVIGDHVDGFEPHDTIATALQHAADALGTDAPEVRWVATHELTSDARGALDGAAAIWCAPGGPYHSLTGALAGIRFAREQRVPFLGTCAGFQHGVIEFARNVLGRRDAAHAEYDGPDGDGELFIDELLCSLVGRTMRVDVVDHVLREMYGDAHATERYYCRFGLHPRWRGLLHEAGLRVAGVDAADGDVRILRLDDHPFYVLTLFVPQTSSAPGAPHPLVTSYVRTACAPRNPTSLATT